jgi:site-specific DNA-methyltransferase (adenine-specific)
MIIHGDCLDIMPTLADKSVDMILCDLPYGTTACKWDTIIPFEPLWAQYKRLIKDNGAIVLTASQPFTSALVMSNQAMFRYEMVWEKDRPSDFGNVNIKPMRYHENILIFYTNTPQYNKSYVERSAGGQARNCYVVKNGVREGHSNEHQYGTKPQEKFYPKTKKVAGSVIKIPIECRKTGQHPTQKPVAMFEYLIKTYTNEGDTVLDNCAGSFTTAIACINTNRKYICIEKDEKYFEIGKNRIVNHQPLLQAVNV